MTRAESSSELGSWRAWHDPDLPIRVGTSACLLGQEVRHDGGHARDRFTSDTLSGWLELVPVCPESEVGMGTPRPTVRLVEAEGGPRMAAPRTGEDWTDRMNRYSARRTRELEAEGIDGFLFKKASPSCGLHRIKVFRDLERGQPIRKDGRGLFAAAAVERWPLLPVEEEGRLNDPALRESFVERVFCHNRWRALLAGRKTRRRLIAFHTAHKLLIRAHDEKLYGELGRLVGSGKEVSAPALFERYGPLFHAALARKTTRRKNTNVLQHALGYLKRLLPSGEKAELLSAIEDYRQGLLPLIVPVTLLRYNVARFEVDYLQGQLYLDPHPKELMLRNHP